MKPYKVLLFAISQLTANTAFTQFNTVSQDVPKYKVSVRSASQPTPRLLDAPLASTNTNSNSLQTGQPKKRIDLRKSVAYPLKHIHSSHQSIRLSAWPFHRQKTYAQRSWPTSTRRQSLRHAARHRPQSRLRQALRHLRHTSPWWHHH